MNKVKEVATAIKKDHRKWGLGRLSARESRLMARAAIAAMREPTEVMKAAGLAENDGDWFDPEAKWNAMIDAALKTGK